MSKPISPDEISDLQKEIFPAEVFDAFNELIAENFSNGYANVEQDTVVNRIIEKGAGNITKHEIFHRGWLNVEEVYRKAGWEVDYDKPGYNETYPASFEFKSKK
jgi:hypothetical protein